MRPLPNPIERLNEIAYNLWWSWDQEARELFKQLDSDLWESTYQNPALMLANISQTRLWQLANDQCFLLNLEHVCQRLDRYINNKQTWHERVCGQLEGKCIAYFSPEFGLTGCLPIYSGGLGILAGDHLKSASDLGLPLIGVSLLYQQGYFNQHLSREGHQREEFPCNSFHTMPIQLQRGEDGAPISINVPCFNRQVTAQVWRVQVGRVPLFLLDTNIPMNSPKDRNITDRLYGVDLDTRISQEIVLGIGGFNALNAMGIEPSVCHMNEGHTAFAALERIRSTITRYGLPFTKSWEIVAASSVFTTHTSVPAGIDRFPIHLMDKYFYNYYPQLGLSRDDFLGLGRENPDDRDEPFAMPILALRLSDKANSVSKLHGEVSRWMWQNIWPDVFEDDVPITPVTNGIHLPSWVSGDSIVNLFNQYLGEDWQEDSLNPSIWEKINDIPNEELWTVHEQNRATLIEIARQRLRNQLILNNATPNKIAMASKVLNLKTLTIGFARRFVEYKRPTLIFRDLDRLYNILTNRERPVQIVIAGKAHPDNDIGKDLIHQVNSIVRHKKLDRHIVFISDYDLTVAHYIVQGVDIWLNTPRRPMEACGTSGMKAAANGALNLSILDGWWAEAYQPEIGWAIGSGEEYEDDIYQDEVDAQDIYHLLEKDIIPLFYDRDDKGLPQKWIKYMKDSMRIICQAFNSNRMVRDYCENFYNVSSELHSVLKSLAETTTKPSTPAFQPQPKTASSW